MSKTEREKGKRGERELVAFLKSHDLEDVKRNQQFKGSPDSPDVSIGKISKLFNIESKRREHHNVYAYIDQGWRDCEVFRNNLAPIVFLRSSGRPWLAVLPGETMAILLRFLQVRLDDMGNVRPECKV